MDRIDIKFMALGAAMLVVGVAMGIYMGIVHDFQLSPVHAHVNLVGWVSLSLFGIVYKLFPELQARRMAKLHFMLAAPAGVQGWRGPYLERGLPKDPWGNPYVYRYPGQRNANGFDLYSFGPDGREGNDDIGNWTN